MCSFLKYEKKERLANQIAHIFLCQLWLKNKGLLFFQMNEHDIFYDILFLLWKQILKK